MIWFLHSFRRRWWYEAELGLNGKSCKNAKLRMPRYIDAVAYRMIFEAKDCFSCSKRLQGLGI